MSRVFVAQELTLERKVVVKVLQPDLAATVNLERFRREIQLAARLQHPHIVPVLTAGVSDGLPFYTMPFIEGESLRARLARMGELPVREVATILRDVLSALSYAHAHNVVHRDIKPDNILLTGHHAVGTEFGVAKALSAATNPGSSLTSLGVALGTPAYMSPEQAAADVNTDHRTDIYAVGATAYEMLTGQHVFSARSPQAMLAAHATEKPEPVDVRRPTVPPILSALVMRALEKHAADRPQSADEMLAELEAAVTPSGATPTGFTPARRHSVWPRRVVVASGIAALAVGGFFGFRSYSETRNLDSNRVIVGPFQNRTGDPSLDNLSTLATDWVARGINETGITDIASFSLLRDATGKIAPSEFETPSLIRHARSLRARRLVVGAFNASGDSVEFQAQIVDAADGSVLQTVAPSTATKAGAMKAIDAMRARVMGALATLNGTEMVGLDMMDPALTVRAYREYARGDGAYEQHDYRNALVHFKRAAELDTTYLAALVRAAYAYMNLDDCAGTDSLGRFLNARRDALSQYQADYLDRVLAWCRGDWNSAYLSAKHLATLAPNGTSAKYIAARSAIPINRLREAVDGLERMNWHDQHALDYYRDLTYALHQLHEYDHELEVADLARERFAGSLQPLVSRARALSALNRPKEVIQLANESLAMRSREGLTPADVMRVAATELAAHGHPVEARSVGEQRLQWIQALPASEREDSLLTDALLIAHRYPEARTVARRLITKHPHDLNALMLDGVSAARLGDTVSASRASTALGELKTPYMTGENVFDRAQIAAILNQKDQAVGYLRESLRQGRSFGDLPDAVPAFLPLHGYPPYEDLVRPKG
jgi:serine/threonine protein kinase/tetratricopeptide (TPR) repeat protein